MTLKCGNFLLGLNGSTMHTNLLFLIETFKQLTFKKIIYSLLNYYRDCKIQFKKFTALLLSHKEQYNRQFLVRLA